MATATCTCDCCCLIRNLFRIEFQNSGKWKVRPNSPICVNSVFGKFLCCVQKAALDSAEDRRRKSSAKPVTTSSMRTSRRRRRSMPARADASTNVRQGKSKRCSDKVYQRSLSKTSHSQVPQTPVLPRSNTSPYSPVSRAGTKRPTILFTPLLQILFLQISPLFCPVF